MEGLMGFGLVGGVTPKLGMSVVIPLKGCIPVIGAGASVVCAKAAEADNDTAIAANVVFLNMRLSFHNYGRN